MIKFKTIFSSFVFLPSFAKERRKMNQKEERKTVVARNGSPKIRSKSTSEFYREILPSCSRNTLKHKIKRKTDKTSRKCECFTSIFVEMIRTMIPWTLCKHLRVSSSNISFRHSRNFSCEKSEIFAQPLRSICSSKTRAALCERFYQYDRTRFFLLSLVRFFLLSSERKRKEMNI